MTERIQGEREPALTDEQAVKKVYPTAFEGGSGSIWSHRGWVSNYEIGTSWKDARSHLPPQESKSLPSEPEPKVGGWIDVNKELPQPRGRRVILTNNINARDAHGDYSHIWIGHVIASSEGGFVAFDSRDRKIENISHWMPLPTEPIRTKSKPIPSEPEPAEIHTSLGTGKTHEADWKYLSHGQSECRTCGMVRWLPLPSEAQETENLPMADWEPEVYDATFFTVAAVSPFYSKLQQGMAKAALAALSQLAAWELTISMAGCVRDRSVPCGWVNRRAEAAELKLSQLAAKPSEPAEGDIRGAELLRSRMLGIVDGFNTAKAEKVEQGDYANGYIDGREHGYNCCGSCSHAWECHNGECGAYMPDGSICGCRMVIQQYTMNGNPPEAEKVVESSWAIQALLAHEDFCNAIDKDTERSYNKFEILKAQAIRELKKRSDGGVK